MSDIVRALRDLAVGVVRWVGCLLAQRFKGMSCPFYRAYLIALDREATASCPQPDEHDRVDRLLAYCAELDATPHRPSSAAALAYSALPWMWTTTIAPAAVPTAEIRRILGVDPEEVDA